MSHRAPKTTAKAEPTYSPDGRAHSGKGNEAPSSDDLAGASRSSGRDGAEEEEPPCSADGGLAGATRCIDPKGMGACVIEEADEDLREDYGPHDASAGRHGMANGAFVIEEAEEDLQKDYGPHDASAGRIEMAKGACVPEEEEELNKRVEKRITLKEMESPDIESEKKFACNDFDEKEDASAPADKDLLSLQFLDISDDQNYIVFKDLDSKTVMSMIKEIMELNIETVLEGKGYSFNVPKCGTMALTFHEGHQQLVIKHLDSLVREFNREETMHMATATVVVLSKIFKALKEGVTITNHDLFCHGKKCFKDIEISDAILCDVCCMLGCTMSSLNVVSTAKGYVTGPLTLRFKTGYSVNCLDKSFGGMRIPNNALEAEIEIEKHEVDFILVLQKGSMFHHLCQMDFHTENKCIMITADGEPDVATLAFLKMLVDVTQLKAYALVDPDAYGVQVLCTYAFGSAKMTEDSSGFAVPSICWLGILPGDLSSLAGLDCSRFPNFSLKEQKILSSVLQHRRAVLPHLWIRMIEQLEFENTKASLECVHSLSFGYLSKVFIPKLLRRTEMQTLSGVSEVVRPEERVDP